MRHREHANLAITLVGVNTGEILGHMALFDYPRLTGVDQAEWESWIVENYQSEKASVRKNCTRTHHYNFHYHHHHRSDTLPPYDPCSSSCITNDWEPLVFDFQPLNSLFIHLFVAKEGFSQAANAELLRYILIVIIATADLCSVILL